MINNKIKIESSERLDDLQLNGLKIIQKKDGYTFTSDSVLLANFVKAKKSDNMLEIGSGTGIVSILVNEKQKPKHITALEIQETYANLSEKNIELNQIKNIEIICDSLQHYARQYQGKQFDIVFTNPPYFKSNNSLKSVSEDRKIARFEDYLPINDLICCTKKLLKFGGKFYFIYSAERLQEIFSLLSNYNFSVKTCYFIYPTNKKNANTVLIEAVLGGNPGTIIKPPVVTNELNGQYVQTLQKLFGTLKDGD